MRPALRVLLLLSFLSASAPREVGGAQQGRPGVSITFLANEGVLIAGGGKSVLIDGLFEKYGSEYATPPDSTQRALASARRPFNTIDLILVTHRHGDHFHPAPALQHLVANPRATLVSSSQVIDSLLSGRQTRSTTTGAMVRRTMPPGQQMREVINGIPIIVLGLSHTGAGENASVEHLGFVVELGGKRILHVGDARTTEIDFAPHRLDTARIDVALVPSWMVTGAAGRNALAKWIKAKQVVAFHFAAGDTLSGPNAAIAALPGTQVFVRPLETKRW